MTAVTHSSLPADPADKPLLPFSVLIGGQLLSFIGTTLTCMAAGIWVFNQTGSVINFAGLTILTLIPAILVSPFGGVIADRFPRKPMMLLVDSMSAITSVSMLLLLFTGYLEIWHLYMNAVVSGLSLGMQRPLYESLTPLMVRQDKLAFVNGIVQSIAGIGQIAAPALAGLLLTFGLKWILILDLATFTIALICIWRVRVPNPPKDVAPTQNWFESFAEGWRFIRNRPGLHAMLWFVTVRSFLFAVCEVVIVPFLLIVSNPQQAGLVLSAGGIGLIVGGLLMGLLGRSSKLMTWIILAQGLTGIAMLFGGFVTDLRAIALILALAFLAFPIEEASSTTILQSKVPSELLGRVSSVRSMMSMSAPPLAMLIAAPLADGVFEPLMRNEGMLSDNIGLYIGTGEGRGMALMILLTGTATLAATCIGWRNRAMRNVETDLPDQAPPMRTADKHIAADAEVAALAR